MKKKSLFQKIKNIKSFGDLIFKIKNKLNHYKRHGTFIVHDWLCK